MSGVKHLIIDGDWSGDEMQLLAVALSNPSRFNILGATATFGNAPLDDVLNNASTIFRMFGINGVIPLYAGADGPTGKKPIKRGDGDGAHGEDGMGGITAASSRVFIPKTTAADFILEQLREKPIGTVNITATGPLTNIAQAYIKDPETMKRVNEIVIMHGCTESMPAHDMQTRRGNITPFAEFNSYMAAEDSMTVLSSGLPITMLPMNCTHQMSFTPYRQQKMRDALRQRPDIAKTVIAMMSAPAKLDKMKFNAAPIMHDVHTALYLIRPDSYSGKTGTVTVKTDGERIGQTILFETKDGKTRVMDTVKDPDALFDIVASSLQAVLRPKPAANAHFKL